MPLNRTTARTPVPDGTTTIGEVAKGLYEAAVRSANLDCETRVEHLVSTMKASAGLLGYRPEQEMS